MELTQNSWATSPGPTFSGDLSIMSSRAEFTKCELKLSLNTTDTKQQEFFLNPSSLSEYANSSNFSLSLFSLCLSTSCLHLCHFVAFKPIGTICLFPLRDSLASGLYPLRSPLSVKQSLLNVFKDGGHLFCNGKDHWRFRNH